MKTIKINIIIDGQLYGSTINISDESLKLVADPFDFIDTHIDAAVKKIKDGYKITEYRKTLPS